MAQANNNHADNRLVHLIGGVQMTPIDIPEPTSKQPRGTLTCGCVYEGNLVDVSRCNLSPRHGQVSDLAAINPDDNKSAANPPQSLPTPHLDENEIINNGLEELYGPTEDTSLDEILNKLKVANEWDSQTQRTKNTHIDEYSLAEAKAAILATHIPKEQVRAALLEACLDELSTIAFSKVDGWTLAERAGRRVRELRQLLLEEAE